jgi:Amt family ammonium transporter
MDTGDTAWVLVATGFVLFMTIPGLALFYGGLVRSRNVLSILMQCLVLTAMLSVLWVAVGYTLAFDTSGMQEGVLNRSSFFGGLSGLGMLGIREAPIRVTIPESLFACYQMTFAIITPALMIGAFAERMRFPAVLLFSGLWLLLVYVPVCHSIWAGAGGLLADWKVLDFAGGIVVHVTAGFGALVACIVVGARAGYPTTLDPPHNMTMTFTGTAMLWFGWFGFNAGSALGANQTAAMALLVTHLSASVATLVWMCLEWYKLGKPGVLGAATGSIAGLAAITPASGFVGPIGAIVIGAASALVCYLAATTIKRRFRYDDSLDVFGVHGVGGFLGTVLAGVFCATSLGGSNPNPTVSMGSQVLRQFLAASGVAIYSMVVSYILLKVLHLWVGLRVAAQVEYDGLDIREHEERGYRL